MCTCLLVWYGMGGYGMVWYLPSLPGLALARDTSTATLITNSMSNTVAMVIYFNQRIHWHSDTEQADWHTVIYPHLL